VVAFTNETQYIGFRFSEDPKSQTGPFRRLLHEADGVVCQPTERRAVDNSLYKFVGVSRQDQPGIVQVGLCADAAQRLRLNVAGFSVVADEVRKLAERASTATREIGGLIGQIQGTVADAVRAMEAGAREVEAGVAHTGSARATLAGVLQAAERVQHQAQSALATTRRMAGLVGSLGQSTAAVSTVVEHNLAAAETLTREFNGVREAVEEFASISEENGAAVEEVGASTEEMNAQVEEVSLAARSLADQAHGLQSLVARFTLPSVAQGDDGASASPHRAAALRATINRLGPRQPAAVDRPR
jgi:methyl-accepting chemotaxis protein